MIGYKIVQKRGGFLFSGYTRDYEICYPIGEWVDQPYDNWPLFVFETRQRAKRFIRENPGPDLFIVKCECENSTISPDYISNWLFGSTLLPAGTILCNRVRILK